MMTELEGNPSGTSLPSLIVLSTSHLGQRPAEYKALVVRGKNELCGKLLVAIVVFALEGVLQIDHAQARDGR